MASADTVRPDRSLEEEALEAARNGRPPSFTHALALCDRFGMMQFANGLRRDPASGYCLDDNARALIVAVAALRLEPGHTQARELEQLALKFVESAQRPDGSFHNLMDASGRFTDVLGSPDSVGRAIWACGMAARSCREPHDRQRALAVLERALDCSDHVGDLRPHAYAALGLAALVGNGGASATPADPAAPPEDGAYAKKLAELSAAMNQQFERNSTDAWTWWEPELSWGNGRPPEALVRAGIALREPRYVRSGLRALEFLGRITQPGSIFKPIGNDGWYSEGGERPLYDQQPIESAAMVDAWLAAAAATGEEKYRNAADTAFAWFFGRNTDGLIIADAATGAAHDGLNRGGIVNANCGAESTLSYLQAHLSLAHAYRT